MKLFLAAFGAAMVTVMFVGWVFLKPNAPEAKKVTVTHTVVKYKKQPKAHYWPDARLLKEFGPDLSPPFSGTVLNPRFSGIVCHIKKTTAPSLVIICV